MDQQRFLQQLQIVVDPSQGDVKAATAVLQKEFYTKPESLTFLLQLIISHDNADLKQLAATQARSLVPKYWTKLPDAQRPAARNQLLQATLAETTPNVRNNASRVISAIAKIDLEDGEWTDLPPFLLKAATSQKKEERAVGVYLLFSLLEIMGDGFVDKFQALFDLFGKTIKDLESFEVRINTMLALSRMAMSIDAEENEAAVKTFQTLVPSMVAVLTEAIDQGDEARTLQAFEVFQTLLGCDNQLLAKHFQDLVVFMNRIAADTEKADDTRIQAISFIMQCLQYRRLRIQGMRIGEKLTTTMLEIVTELGDAPADDDDMTPARSALSLIDIMAQQLPSAQIVVPLLNNLKAYASHQDPNYRKAGILALGYCVEGAPDFLSTQMKEITPVLLHLLDDQVVKVRQAALQATARLADDLPEDLGKIHEKLMPALFKNLHNAMQGYKGEEEGPNIDIMRGGASAIDALVGGMDEEDAVIYLDKLVPLLQKLFQHPDPRIKALSAGAIGSFASTVESAFEPYLTDSMNSMQSYLTKKENEEELDLRAAVTDAMGEMAVAVGPEQFQQYVRPLMQASEEALQLDHSKLKESAYILWGSLAKVYEKEFAPFLEGAINGLFACLDQEEADIEVDLGQRASDLLGQEVVVAGKKVKVASATDDDFADVGENGEIEDVDIDDDADWDDLTTVTAVALEKEIAMEVIGDLVGNTGSAFLPYFEKTITKILPECEHTFEGVRKATLTTLHRAYAALWDVTEEAGQMQKWRPGLPLQIPTTAEISKFGEILMTATLGVWEDEADRYGSLVSNFGPDCSPSSSMMTSFAIPAHSDTPIVWMMRTRFFNPLTPHNDKLPICLVLHPQANFRSQDDSVRDFEIFSRKSEAHRACSSLSRQ